MTNTYYAPHGGLPAQTELTTNRAVFTPAYAVLPRGTMRDIVTSLLPHWNDTRLWIIARPLSGFAETFSQYIVEVQPGGGSDRPERDPGAECVIFLMEGQLTITLDGTVHEMGPGATPSFHPEPTGSSALSEPNRPVSTGSARPTTASTASNTRPHS